MSKELTTKQYVILKQLVIKEIDVYEESKSAKTYYNKLLIINEKLEKKIQAVYDERWKELEKENKRIKKELGWLNNE